MPNSFPITLTIILNRVRRSDYQPSVDNLGGGGLGTLGRGDLLAVLVVANTRGRSAVATSNHGTDTRSILSAHMFTRI